MNWAVFAVVLYLLLAMQTGLSILLGFELDWLGGIELAPRLVLLLPVLVGLFGPSHASMIAFAVAGFCLDLLSPHVVLETTGEGAAVVRTAHQVTLIGPYTLGYLAAGYLLAQLRTMVYRENPLAFGVCVVICGVAVHLIVVAFLSIRGWYDPLPDWSAGAAFLERAISIAYTGGLAVLLAWPLMKMRPLFGFQISKVRGR